MTAQELEAFKQMSAKINAISELSYANKKTFYCKKCRHDLPWDQVFFSNNGKPCCIFHRSFVQVRQMNMSRVVSGELPLCGKPYPLCRSQVMMRRSHKPVIFCADTERCLKAVYIDSPKNRSAPL